MSLINQKTIKKPVSFSGVGLHSGRHVNMTVKPSGPDTGIIFKRVDLKKDNLIYNVFTSLREKINAPTRNLKK